MAGAHINVDCTFIGVWHTFVEALIWSTYQYNSCRGGLKARRSRCICICMQTHLSPGARRVQNRMRGSFSPRQISNKNAQHLLPSLVTLCCSETQLGAKTKLIVNFTDATFFSIPLGLIGSKHVLASGMCWECATRLLHAFSTQPLSISKLILIRNCRTKKIPSWGKKKSEQASNRALQCFKAQHLHTPNTWKKPKQQKKKLWIKRKKFFRKKRDTRRIFVNLGRGWVREKRSQRDAAESKTAAQQFGTPLSHDKQLLSVARCLKERINKRPRKAFWKNEIMHIAKRIKVDGKLEKSSPFYQLLRWVFEKGVWDADTRTAALSSPGRRFTLVPWKKLL